MINNFLNRCVIFIISITVCILIIITIKLQVKTHICNGITIFKVVTVIKNFLTMI